ncbi:hypothetical protein An08g02890 [Aspergillus niger]|uniref:Uncharacterized protein n=2 Tax=Aspergillus niger TaxID=5061 RepID=A2QQL0_ASPNC|nr:hypothetical protein An08g02890 [Aspergillus niger]CAK45326.1 hypothetical protein An08g02890 [Aspergillus niger]
MKLKEEETLKAFGCMYCAFRCDKIGRLHNTEELPSRRQVASEGELTRRVTEGERRARRRTEEGSNIFLVVRFRLEKNITGQGTCGQPNTY